MKKPKKQPIVLDAPSTWNDVEKELLDKIEKSGANSIQIMVLNK